MKDTKIKVGITQGDINGIGYEVIIKTLMDPRILELCTPIIYGSPKVAAYHKKALDIEEFSLNNVKTAQESHPKRINIINCTDENIKVELGKSTSSAGIASFASLEAAVKDLKEGDIDVLLTAPINKKNIQSKNFVFPGHTEYLEARIDSGKSLMLLISEKLRVGVVTGHIPISKVSENITEEKIIDKLDILNKSLIQDFGIRKPKVAVLSLNPHAGDDGLIGSEEKDVIIPAIEKARKSGIMALGPYPADGFFGSNDYSKFDAILAMYHDQGLTAFKALSFDSGVNFTAGLSKVRTSPAHGTAYAIAGTNVASPESFQKALYMAIDVYRNRMEYEVLSKDPMKVKAPSTDHQNKRQSVK
ncbi:4-hydroxythreonine-4-phosphate dehydrogenase PdxA [Ancylomarina euxinus]|uniref:4-hydroxythreonine-4-phosphate dehydrogenase PdxA n=1 Tax=Ancylomarina euxinus TaxID=2283627 RepID=A0A425XYU4_9BACT|nr:4-hydroxythreonine-4-phosphate dehydrogenase PdxA [Ancylomarina euxinus]MCZ4695641.1 4-hydroxythreonine-4-phosphate dehydrogenase PdxA [Ancylomarina euxinus]MUP16055.1 4-hydroxythreonine-4-phosphate dehydrogenase PdxA [Ancylomarina euxinus]RRG20299.1 4-hydroxythreonine-4-phosphate dehydrogenase PdxA [Ancylomarina euxinus]